MENDEEMKDLLSERLNVKFHFQTCLLVTKKTVGGSLVKLNKSVCVFLFSSV